MRSPYDVLGIDPDADEEAIERAYRRRVKETHPDHGGSAEAFRDVRAAYETIAENGAASLPEGANGNGAEPRSDRRDVYERAGRDDPDPRETPTEEREFEVEYLDYEAIADRGWDLKDEGLFERASAAGLGPPDRGRIDVEAGESLLEAAEDCGYEWPYACRGGACANCAVAVLEGDLSTPANHVLPREMVDRGIRLSCVGTPTTPGTKVVYNVKHLPDLDDLRLPPGPFDRS